MNKPLKPEQAAAVAPPKTPEERTPILPVPADAPPMRFKHPEYGLPSRSWEYRDAEGRLLCHVARFDYHDGGRPEKILLPICYCALPDGKRGWRAKGLPAPRPLYRLDRIVASADEDPQPRIIVCEGEKTADAAARLFPDAVCTTPMHGAQSPHLTDWSPLAGRDVVIAPDADEAGEKFALTVAGLAQQADARSVELLPHNVFSSTYWEGDRKGSRPWGNRKKGYDLADAVADGWTAERVQERAEKKGGSLTIRLPEDHRFLGQLIGWTWVWTKGGTFRFNATSVEQLHVDDEGNEHWQYLCSHIVVTGHARSTSGDNWGIVVELKDPDNRLKQLILPAKLFAGDAKAVWEQLLAAGAHLSSGRSQRAALMDYLTGAVPPDRRFSVPAPGWHDDAFVLPDVTFGAKPGERYVIADPGAESLFACGGTLQGWQDTIGQLALGNSRLIFAIAAGFSGPLQRLLDVETPVFHLVGRSSEGKSLIGYVGASVFGMGCLKGFVQSWRTTDNALEFTARRHSDTLLVLDELGLADPAKVGDMLYMLVQAIGKSRAGAEGGLLETPTWRIVVLSTGESPLEAYVETGPRRAAVRAGQVLRLVSFPANPGCEMGIFEEIHGRESTGVLWDELGLAAKTHYGHAGRAFLAKLIGAREDSIAVVKAMMQDFLLEHCGPEASGQIRRVAQKFAVVAAAGELAAALGVVPWPKGTAYAAASTCFNAWMEPRISGDTEEERSALKTVRRFLEAHGESRFSVFWNKPDGDKDSDPYERYISNRAGFRRHDGSGWLYHIMPEAWADLCAPLDPKQVAETLYKKGHLVPGEKTPSGSERLQRKCRLPGFAKPVRCYVVKSTLLAGDPGPDERNPDEDDEDQEDA